MKPTVLNATRPSAGPSFEITSTDVRVLLDAGFAAIRRNQIKAAKDIFDGLSPFRPNEVGVQIGRALVLVAEGKFEKALAALRPSPDHPSGSVAKLSAFRALVVLLSGDAAQCVALIGAMTRIPGGEDEALLSQLRDAAFTAVTPTNTSWRRMATRRKNA